MIAVIMEMKDLVTFKSLGPYMCGKRRAGFYLPCPFDIDGLPDLDYLLNRQILIDGEVYLCHSVEIEGIGPMKKGGQIAVWVSKISEDSQKNGSTKAG